MELNIENNNKPIFPVVIVYNKSLFGRNNNFSLKKVNPYELIIELPSMVKESISSFTVNNINKNFETYVLDFYNIISKIPTVDLNYFLYNLNTLKITKEKHFFCKNVAKGFYNIETNEIMLSNINVLFHELFHMASSYFDINENIFSGFSQYLDINKKTIGLGLTEGYTDVLTERYFHHDDDFFSFYQIEMYFASKLEEIIEKDKMENLYFKADLFNLVEELKQYMTYEEIINFITNLDFINEHIYDRKINTDFKKEIEIKLLAMNKFILKCFLKKIKLQFDKKKISLEKLDKILIDYLSSKPQIIKVPNKKNNIVYYLYHDVEKEINNLVKEVFNDSSMKLVVHNPISKK